MIQVYNEDNVKKVNKPCGYELWMADDTNSKFAFKKIFIKKWKLKSIGHQADIIR